MANYFTDEDDAIWNSDNELRALINECMEPIFPEFKAEYLINCLIPKFRQNMTPKQIFEDELRAKKKFEESIDYNR